MEININNFKTALHWLNRAFLAWQDVQNKEKPSCYSNENWIRYVTTKTDEYKNYLNMLNVITFGYYLKINEKTGLYCIYESYGESIIVEGE